MNSHNRYLLSRFLNEDNRNRYENINNFVDDLVVYILVQMKYSEGIPYYMSEEFNRYIPDIGEHILMNIKEDVNGVYQWCQEFHAMIIENCTPDVSERRLYYTVIELAKRYVNQLDVTFHDTFFGFVAVIIYLVYYLCDVNKIELAFRAVSTVRYITIHILEIKSVADIRNLRRYAFNNLLECGFFAAAFNNENGEYV